MFFYQYFLFNSFECFLVDFMAFKYYNIDQRRSLMKKIKLSNREAEVMVVLWNSDKPLAATDIPAINPELSVNTVQAALKNLLKKSYIKVADIIYHGTVLTRSYEPLLTHEDYINSQLEDTVLTPYGYAASLVKNEENENLLNELEQIIKEQKKKLKKR